LVEKSLKFCAAQVQGMLLVAEQDVAPVPGDAGDLSTQGIVLETEDITHLFKKFLRARCHFLNLAVDWGDVCCRLGGSKGVTRLPA
jgi:hypothetical protein